MRRHVLLNSYGIFLVIACVGLNFHKVGIGLRWVIELPFLFWGFSDNKLIEFEIAEILKHHSSLSHSFSCNLYPIKDQLLITIAIKSR